MVHADSRISLARAGWERFAKRTAWSRDGTLDFELADVASPIWYAWGLSPLFQLSLNPASALPLYRQLSDSIRELIASGSLQAGDRLPATRELAGRLGLNRTTVSAAYAALEESGLLEGQVGRGSFVAALSSAGGQLGSFRKNALNWGSVLRSEESSAPSAAPSAEISFASSRPPERSFPLDAFRRLAIEVVESGGVEEILQLGSPYGYRPLRRYLLEQSQEAGVARADDDVLITNGCQQALDLLARSLGTEATVIMEDPVYHGLVRVFEGSGCALTPVPMDEDGIEIAGLERALAGQGTRVVMVTPSFQNPTGATLPFGRRKAIVDLVQRTGAVLVENDIYSELRYEGDPLPTLKELDATGNTILLRSYSKVAFPGLRVGWVVAPQPVIARLAEAKQWADLHSDHLSQAILLRFAQSGALAQHLERTCRDGRGRLRAVLEACERFLPLGSRWTRPEGGMSMWVTLPAQLDTGNLLTRLRERGVDFLPGSYFSACPVHRSSLRLGFGGLTPEAITRGVSILGAVAAEELAGRAASARLEPAVALV